MLEVIREFALEYLKKSGELNTLQKNHACFFLKLAEKAEPNLTAKRSVKWLEKLEIEINNIRAALDWSLHQDPEITGRIMGATRYFWSNHNYLTEGRKWLEKSLKKSVNVPVKIRFKLLNALGQFSRNQGDYTASKKFNELGLKEGRTANDLQQIVISLHGLAAVATRQGDFETAQKINEEQLKIVRQSDFVYEIATTLSALSDVLIAKGETETARPLIEESLTLSKQIGNSYILCINLINLGTVEYNEKNYETAYRNFAKSLLTAQDLGNKTLISCSLDGLAAVAVSCGKAEQSAHLAGAAENLRKSIGYEIEPTERIFRDSYTTKIRNILDEKSFNDAFEKGLEFSLREGFIPALKLNAEDFINVESSEIIIEKHIFERIIIEEEFEKDES
jgi:tetratricopeptide (TPR) repeat protein